MFSENNKDMTHCTTQLIDLTLGEHLQILGERREGMYTRNSSGDEIANVNFFTTTSYM